MPGTVFEGIETSFTAFLATLFAKKDTASSEIT
jgi:hypothetical protein